MSSHTILAIVLYSSRSRRMVAVFILDLVDVEKPRDSSSPSIVYADYMERFVVIQLHRLLEIIMGR